MGKQLGDTTSFCCKEMSRNPTLPSLHVLQHSVLRSHLHSIFLPEFWESIPLQKPVLSTSLVVQMIPAEVEGL